jgi:hypothetical protein
MLQWHPKLIVLVAILAVIAALAAFGVLSLDGFDTSNISW